MILRYKHTPMPTLKTGFSTFITGQLREIEYSISSLINGLVKDSLSRAPIHADNAAAISAGMKQGDYFTTPAGEVRIVV